MWLFLVFWVDHLPLVCLWTYMPFMMSEALHTIVSPGILLSCILFQALTSPFALNKWFASSVASSGTVLKVLLFRSLMSLYVTFPFVKLLLRAIWKFLSDCLITFCNSKTLNFGLNALPKISEYGLLFWGLYNGVPLTGLIWWKSSTAIIEIPPKGLSTHLLWHSLWSIKSKVCFATMEISSKINTFKWKCFDDNVLDTQADNLLKVFWLNGNLNSEYTVFILLYWHLLFLWVSW